MEEVDGLVSGGGGNGGVGGYNGGNGGSGWFGSGGSGQGTSLPSIQGVTLVPGAGGDRECNGCRGVCRSERYISTESVYLE